MRNITITTRSRADYDAICAALTGDCKHTIEAEETGLGWDFIGTISTRDYDDMYNALIARVPYDRIVITLDGVKTELNYDYDDDADYLMINGKRV